MGNMARDIYDIFSEMTGLDLDDFLKKVKAERDKQRLGLLIGSIIRSMGDEYYGESEFLRNVKTIVEDSLGGECFVMVYNRGEHHIIGELPENAELKLRSRDETM